MLAQVNIGLHIEETGRDINPIQAISALNVSGITIHDGYIATAQHERGEEQTLVLLIGFEGNQETLSETLYIVSGLLQQDCIAIQWQDGTGTLVGPKAAEWGSFDSKYFLTLAGNSRARQA